MISWLSNNYIEVMAALLGIAGVWLTTRQLIWCWPVGLANVILSMFVFFEARLYADVLLQCFYLVMTLYGWYHWVFGKEGRRQLSVSHIKPALLVALIIAGALGSALAGYLFSTYTNASLPYWDAAVAVWGVIATYAMARKIIENWIMWIITDAVCVGIYFYKELFAFTVLYFIFTVLAAYGYYKWSKDYKSLRAIS